MGGGGVPIPTREHTLWYSKYIQYVLYGGDSSKWLDLVWFFEVWFGPFLYLFHEHHLRHHLLHGGVLFLKS
jgi:hypothetical protein